MGNDNSPEHSPNRVSRPKRILSNTKTIKNTEIPIIEKPRIVQNISKLSKILSRPKYIMNFVAQTENNILLKNMNDSLSIGFNNLNILIENDFNNPFLENQLKYYQVVDDSIDKKILGKLNYQNKEYNQKQIEFLANNLIEINNNSISNNINIGNISSIHKKNREESPTSQREEELDLTSFSTTIGGKISSNTSNYNKNQNSKQIKTFKIRKKDCLITDVNYKNPNNNNNFKNNSSRHDSPNSIPTITSSNTIGNVLSSINATNIHSKNSSNISLKDKNSNINNINNNCNRNDSSNKNINNNNKNTQINNSKNSNKNNIIENNDIKINKIINNKNHNKIISKKIVKKQIIGMQKKPSSPQDKIKSPRKENIFNIGINNNINNHNNNNKIGNNVYINNTKPRNNNKKIKRGFAIPNLNLGKDNRAKSPNFGLNNIIPNNILEEQESENSQIIFNNVRPLTQRNNNSYTNNNSSMINNLSSLNQNSKINNTNILNEDKYIKFLNDSNLSNLKTEPNKENNSYVQGIGNKNIIINDEDNNIFKINHKAQYKNNKNIKQSNNENIIKIDEQKLKRLNTVNAANCNKKSNLKKENRTIENNLNNNKRIINISKTEIKDENKFNNQNLENKNNICKINKIINNKNKINNKNLNSNTKNLIHDKNISQKNTNNNEFKISNFSNKKKQEIKKNKIAIFDDNLDNINFLVEEPQNSPVIQKNQTKKTSLNTEEIFNKKKLKHQINLTEGNNINEFIDSNSNKYKTNNNIKDINKFEQINNINTKKKVIKKQKKKQIKNLVFNIDLSDDINNNDNENNKKKNTFSDDNQSKSEDISDNSFSHEEKIQINNLERKIRKPLKIRDDKSNIINDNKFNNIMNKNKITNYIQNQHKKQIHSDTNFLNFDKYNNKIHDIKENISKKKNNTNKKQILKKETNIPNSKINRLVFDIDKNNNENNSDDLDDVCNFSGINNKSYTNQYDNNYSKDFNNDILDEDLKRAKSPKAIIHKKSNFNFINNDLTEQLEKENNINNIINDYNDIFEKINIKKKKLDEKDSDINNEIKSSVLKEIINNQKKINSIDNKQINNNIPKSISCSSNDNFSFKAKKNDIIYDSKKDNNNNENENNKIKNDSIFESKESSKFNFQINDDIHESEFNDIDFLD